jgi:DNA-binding MarR family transcriptional regulator
MDENEKRNPSLNVWELNLISYILKSRFNSLFGTDELNGPTIRVLYYMYRENIYSPIALAKYLSFSRATITGHLHILEKYGYIALKPDQKDRRKKVIVLTDMCRKKMEMFTGLIHDFHQEVDSLLTNTERKSIDSIYRKLTKKYRPEMLHDLDKYKKK